MQPIRRQSTSARAAITLGCLVAGLTICTTARAQITLQNDNWFSGQPAGFQGGFVTGEEGAVTIGPVSQGMLLNTVQFLFGGQSTAASVTLRIYEDLGTAEPGPMLHQETLYITGSDQILQEVDVLQPQIYIPTGGSIRISFRFVHSGLPSIARESAGSIQTGKNWINAAGLGWVDAQILGLTGDFVIRALVNPSTGPGADAGVDGGVPSDGGVDPDASTDPDAGVNPDGGTDPDAAVNPDGGVDPDAIADPDGGADPDASVNPDGGTDPTSCEDDSACAGGYACHRGDCLPMCINPDDCADDTLCHQGVCAPLCADSTECSGGQVCENGLCVSHCTADEECLAGEECVSFRCRTTSPHNGGCGCSGDPDLRAIALPALLLLALLLGLARRLRSSC